jgi:gamma-glutamyltranspeptidase/glutathione hydrolase
VTLRDRYGTRPLAELLAPAAQTAEQGFPVMEKCAEDWKAEEELLRRDAAAAATYLVNGAAPRAGDVFRNPNLGRTLRALGAAGREAYYNGAVGRAMVEYFKQHGGFITMEDLAAQHAEWVEPLSTTYRGYTVYELPPNGQGLTALLALNILEGFDLAAMKAQPDRYYHTLIESLKLAFADRNRYIADPKFARVPVQELLSKEYAAKRRALINPDVALTNPEPGVMAAGSTTYFTVVDKDGNAVSFINSLYEHFGSGIVAGDTGIVLQDRGAGFSLDPQSPNRIEPGKRPFHTLVPAMVLKEGKLFASFGVMGGDMQTQGHVQVLSAMIDLGMDVQRAIEMPRFRYDGARGVRMETEMGSDVIQKLAARGHTALPAPRSQMGGGQIIAVDPVTGALLGGSDSRKDGMALGY